MKNIILLLSILFCLRLVAQEKVVEEKLPKVTVKMLDGEEYTGTIKEKSKYFLIIETKHGELKLKTESIKDVKEEEYEGEFAFGNPHTTRYYFGPSAKPLKKGEGYYQNVMITGNFINIGVTNNLSLGGGLEFISLILGNPIFFFTPKLSFGISPKTDVSAGAIVVGIPEDIGGNGNGITFATLVYGAFTQGSDDHHISLGVGYGIANGELARYPAVNLSGFTRLSKSFGAMSENYLIPAFGLDVRAVYVGVHGFRIIGKKSAFDFGVIIGEGEIVPIPWIGYARAF